MTTQAMKSWCTWVKLCTLVQELQDLRQLVFIQPALVAHSPSSAHFWHRSCKNASEHLMARQPRCKAMRLVYSADRL